MTMVMRNATGRLDLQPDTNTIISIMWQAGRPVGAVVKARKDGKVSSEVLDEFDAEISALFHSPGDTRFAFYDGAGAHTPASLRSPGNPFPLLADGLRVDTALDVSVTKARLEGQNLGGDERVLEPLSGDPTFGPLVQRLRAGGSSGSAVAQSIPDQDLAWRLLHVLLTAEAIYVDTTPQTSLHDLLGSFAPPPPAVGSMPPLATGDAARAPALSEDELIERALESQRFLRSAQANIAKGDVRSAEADVARANELDLQEEGRVLEVWIRAQKPENQDETGTRGGVNELDAILAANPSCERAYFYRGVLNKRLGQIDSATSDFEQSLALRPGGNDTTAELRLLRSRSHENQAAHRSPQSASSGVAAPVVAAKPASPPDPRRNRKILIALAVALFVAVVVQTLMNKKSSQGVPLDDPSTMPMKPH